jgi:cytochrome c-type biogenesis protein CcmH/NrfG
MALALLSQGNAQDAVPYYRKALDLRPNWPEALNDLAWLLATHPSTGLRDGIEAVRLAERACELSHRQEARFLGTLDAAYAEAGRFEEAIRTAETTRQMALGAQQPEIAGAAAERLKLYQSKLAFRQNP